ncbi:cobyrinate a,c-diamide synthase [Actinoplanes sp. NPDC051411]|uniref:cobyrinate a,c-diamide synthase n=1 Tax=Actinoplanes sp. NPDC051411 TaxID=3155522 RepID=UPI00342022FF
MNVQPRLVVSAPSSGHGKTAIAVGLLAAAAARGVTASGFKVGPDHTDAAYLGLAAGRPGRNLDPRLVGAQRVAPLFAHGAAGSQLAVIEGAMGLFDSLTGQPEIDGTAAVAATLRAPVVLVVDVAAMGHSIAALVHGFRMFDEMVHLGGVILNRIASPRHEQMLRTALDDIGMPVLGALRRGDLPNVLPARAHGPVPVAHRTVEASRAVRRLGEAVVGGLDLDRLIALANSAPALPSPLWTPAEAIGSDPFEQRPVVALAGGPGAPYTYVETAELLTAAGADVAIVDPLRDEMLPAGTRALVVGAGLPEGYAEELSANRRLCNTVAKFAADGWPVIAEGVALPWLGHEFDGRPMCGVLDATAYTGEQTVAGYREATAPTTSVLAPGGARITGYKQHRAVVTPRAGAVPAWTWSGGNPEGFVWRQVHASQLGLHWSAAPEIAKRIVAAAIAGPASLQQPKQTPAPASPVAMSSPPPAMPTVGAATTPEMPSQVSGPDFGPPPVERGDLVPGRADHRGTEFGAGFAPGEPEYAGGPSYAPSGSDYAPAGSDYAAAGSDYAPAGSDYAPAGSDYAPAGSDYAPAGSDYAPAVSDYVSGPDYSSRGSVTPDHVEFVAAEPAMAQRSPAEAPTQPQNLPPRRPGEAGPTPGLPQRGPIEGRPQVPGMPPREPSQVPGMPPREPGQVPGMPPREPGQVPGMSQRELGQQAPGMPSREPGQSAPGMSQREPRELGQQAPGMPPREQRELAQPMPGMPLRGPGEAGPSGHGLGERVAAEFGSVYGAHSNGIATERPGAAPDQGRPGQNGANLSDTVDIAAS